MSDTGDDKPRGSGADADDPGVLGRLPRTRPGRTPKARAEAAGEPAAPTPAAKARGARKPAAPRTPKRTSGAAPKRTRAGAAPPARDAAVPTDDAPDPRRARRRAAGDGGPRAVSAGSPDLAGPESPRRAAERPLDDAATPEPPAGVELLTTAVRAAGELALIGVTLGRRVLRHAVERLPGR